jgi:dihydrodipicolinate synthase/N-acetylneuraminate lyase
MALLGLIQETYRLPLCEPGAATRAKLSECLKEIELL